MLKKLSAYPRQNGLAKALREVGRIERTLFTLDWIKNPDLRRRAHLGLNKNALARAVYFCRLGEVRDRSFENQFFRASGLNLLVLKTARSTTGSASRRPEPSYACQPPSDQVAQMCATILIRPERARELGMPVYRRVALRYPARCLGARSVDVLTIE
jgi:hypothetical protein